jgi:serine/threonine protein kinase
LETSYLSKFAIFHATMGGFQLRVSDPMGLPAGTLLGPYEIVCAIGAGGMGEVYEARDKKLGRNVAIKVLPEAFAHDAERLSRFQREARMLAALNHPNIATIFGLEQAGPVHYLVMELVPGQTLAERLTIGPVGIEEALKIAGQIAEALEAAHEKRVVHRDLKPANVKVTPEGRVKVLDFGLAKAFDAEQDLRSAATLTSTGTEDGRILGTPTYMSPEQARGKPVDKRTDIWAFGCVFYELLSGRRAFQADTVSDTLVKVLEREPDWKALPAVTPAKVQDLLHRCLEKDVNLRLRDIGDGRMELLNALAGTTRQDVVLEERFKLTRRAAIGGLAGTAAVVAGVATSAWYLWPKASKPVMRLNMDVSPAQQFAGFT